ncbi:MAG: hypothetical protein V7774_08090 [Pseudorhizobium pelagicum]|uniref:hypothetical protein n=1 Tax=Pseudorhizobium pelagicum TaxID=1509405 RepID=UPI0034605FC8
MSVTTDLVSELVRAANKPEKLSAVERQGLFTRTVVMAQIMRNSIAIPSVRREFDKIVERVA